MAHNTIVATNYSYNTLHLDFAVQHSQKVPNFISILNLFVYIDLKEEKVTFALREGACDQESFKSRAVF